MRSIFITLFSFIVLMNPSNLFSQPNFQVLHEFEVVLAVSDDGLVVVGGSRTTVGFREAARWKNGSVHRLGHFNSTGPIYAPNSNAVSSSSNGSVIVGASNYYHSSSTGIRFQAVRWVEDGPIEGIGFLPGGLLSSAHGVSADGAVIVGWGHTGNTREPFRLENGQMQGLGHLYPAATLSEAYDVSADGTIVVGRSGDVNDHQAFRWENGTMTGLGFLMPEHRISIANAISADGRVIVGSSGSGNRMQAFRWEDGHMVGLEHPAGCRTQALGVSGDGSVVVGSYQCQSNPGAFIWTAETGVRSLWELLESNGVDLTGWSYPNRAIDVSADGRVIVGFGFFNGISTGWRAVLSDTSDVIVVTVTDDEPNHPDSMAGNICDVDPDEPGEQCTLRAAIELANQRGGGTIHFDIPGGGVPRIEVTEYSNIGEPFWEGLPSILSPIIIDGTTQPGGWVEITGTRDTERSVFAHGLRVTGGNAAGTEIRGLVINRFWGSGIRIDANNVLIENNRIGTDISGTESIGNATFFSKDENATDPWWYSIDGSVPGPAAGVWIIGTGNTIRNNIIAGNARRTEGADGFVFDGGVDIWLDKMSSSNQIVSNRIGIGANGNPIVVKQVYNEGICCTTISIGVLVQGEGNRVGGEGNAGNQIAGQDIGILVLTASNHVIQGNQINQVGLENPKIWTPGFREGIRVISRDASYPTSPPENPHIVIRGNQISAIEQAAIIEAPSTIVGNKMEGFVYYETATRPYNHVYFHSTAVVEIESDDVIFVGNKVDSFGWALLITGNHNGIMIKGNDITSEYGGIRLPHGNQDPNNFFEEYQRAVISQNSIRSVAIGIDLGGLYYSQQPDGVTQNDVNDADWGANDLQNFPEIYIATRDGSSVTVEGGFDTPLLSRSDYRIEAFGNHACLEHTSARRVGFQYGPGEVYLGAIDATPHLGRVTFSGIFHGLEGSHNYVTMTATRLDREVTSEFSRCIRIVDANKTARSETEPDEAGQLLADLGVVVLVDDVQAKLNSIDGVLHNGGTIFVTRYDEQPKFIEFGENSAPSGSGTLVDPKEIVSGYWMINKFGFAVPEGSDPVAFEVCLDPAGMVHPDDLSNSVIVKRNELSGGIWIPLNTKEKSFDGKPYLCAAGIRELGDFSIAAEKFEGFVTVINDEYLTTPYSYSRLKNHPNPFNFETTITLHLKQSGDTFVRLFDMQGRLVKEIYNGHLQKGENQFSLSAEGLVPGIYILQAGNALESHISKVMVGR